MPKYCETCGTYSLPEHLTDGDCLPCYIRANAQTFIDPQKYATKLVAMSMELEQLRERRKEAVALCERYRAEIARLKTKLEVALNGS